MTTVKVIILLIIFIGTSGAVFSEYFKEYRFISIAASFVAMVGGVYLFSDIYHDLIAARPTSDQMNRITPGDTTYIDKDDRTVLDQTTGLIWKKCSEGLSGKECNMGNLAQYSRENAKLHADEVHYAGYSDWRLPRIDELATLLLCTNNTPKKNALIYRYGCAGDYGQRTDYQRPTINALYFPSTKVAGYWSSSPDGYFADSAWSFVFSTGSRRGEDRASLHPVRLVRNSSRSW